MQIGDRMPHAQARVLQQILAGEGITAELVHGHLPGAHCRLYVDEAAAPLAEVFLAASDADVADEAVCWACGEANPGTFASCWQCQADLDKPGEVPEESPEDPQPAQPTVSAAGVLTTAVLFGALLVLMWWLFDGARLIPFSGAAPIP